MKRAFLLFFVLSAVCVMAQSRRELPPLPPIGIKVAARDNVVPVQVQEASIEAEINGVLAETRVTLTLFNPNGRVLEGELEFPLPAGATVAGYALDVNGQMVEGVVVEKAKARVVFDEVARQGVDPGLAEQVGGNMFRTKVYPLPAQGMRRISVRYVSTTKAVTEGGKRVYYHVQPLNFPGKLRRFRLKMNVAAAVRPPEVVAGAATNLAFKQWRTFYTAETVLEDIALTEDLTVAVMARPEEDFLHQRASDGQEYFHYAFTVSPTMLQESVPQSTEPVIVWDASMSRDKSEHDAEFAFIKAAFGQAKKLTLVVFRNVPEAPRVFDSAEALVKALETVVYDGATNLAAAVAAIPADAEACLFTDGLDNFSAAKALPKAARLSVFTADKQQNAPALRALVRDGAFLDLRNISTADAVKMLGVAQPSVVGVQCDGKALEYVWELEGDRLHVAGALPEGARTVAVAMRVGGREVRREAAVAEANALPAGGTLRTGYGQLKIAELLSSGAAEAEVTAAGKRFGLVTPGTSLLVLDSLDQYVRYRVRPPEGLAEMRRRYDEIVKRQKNARWGESFQLQEKPAEQVLRMWNALLAWYGQDYPREAAKAKKAKREESRRYSAPVLDGAAGAVAYAAEPEEAAEPRLALRAANEAPCARMAAARAPAAPRAPEAAPGGPKAVMKAWNPQTPYLEALKAAGKGAYGAYLKQRAEHGASAGFYMDCADYLERSGERALALRVLSNLVEMDLENKQVLRVLGYKLRFWGELASAEAVFRAVLKLAPEEPQSYRDLALTLDDQGRFQEAVDMMMHVVRYRFDGRFREIEVIALTEINRMILRAERKGIAIQGVDKRFVKPIQTDVRVVINWDTDMSDMDLWVTDPFGEKCFYSHRFTSTGGRNSCDFTQGYGPEEFMIREAVKGEYKVQTDYYGTHSQKVLGPVTLYAEVFTDYGRENETRQVLAFRLSARKQVVDVAVISQDGVRAGRVHAKPFPYQVKKGDTLESISIAFYGDKSYVDAIAELNHPNVAKDRPLKAGSIITLPATRK